MRHHAAAGQGKMVAIAIFSADPAMRRRLEQLLREDSALSIIGVVDDPTVISLLVNQNHVNVVLADVPPRERLADWRIRHNQTAFVIFVDGADEDDSLDALYAGARAILPRTAKPDGDLHEQILHIEAHIEGLADVIESCRKFILISKVAMAAGGTMILAIIIGAVGFDPALMIGALAAVIGGTVVCGSNTSTLKQTTTAMKATEAQRAELISKMGLRMVGDGEVGSGQ